MSYDLYAELLVRDKEKIETKIREFRGGKAQREEWMEENLPRFFREKLTPKNWYTLIKEVSLFEKYYEEYNDDRKEDIKAGYKKFIRDTDIFSVSNGGNLGEWTIFKEIKEPKTNVETLPDQSTLIKVTFTLKKPYISQDNEEFYIIDNPLSKEKVFKVPYVRASSWKGNLRWIMKDVIKVEGDIIRRIFGNERNESEDKNLRRGRLQFYPTFFNKIGLDVINPHDRKTKTGKNPILYEIVPEEASGTFSLLYVPFDLIGNEDELKKQVDEDLKLIAEAVKKLLTIYGFSAKKTAGFGVTNEIKENEINVWPEDKKSMFSIIYSKHNKNVKNSA
ncbi:MAG: hypothetical protein A7316_04480 [Candidatus Altiarchaeales archaeon WOR_SM1_86-2]|nr:MAG: hypothetical protein A7316_04480 [Candidatus Altiarchaeales archaeon WOR_SM1_86-2]ODS37842.1 MAG: hypothetical protein A7315_03535 [Candidatus Altiarchaeales archaeon WOR_SM1_79]